MPECLAVCWQRVPESENSLSQLSNIQSGLFSMRRSLSIGGTRIGTGGTKVINNTSRESISGCNQYAQDMNCRIIIESHNMICNIKIQTTQKVKEKGILGCSLSEDCHYCHIVRMKAETITSPGGPHITAAITQ